MAATITQLLPGARTLVSWHIEFADGRPRAYPFGEDAEGLIVYTPDGWMSAAITHAKRKPLSAETPRGAPEGEQMTAFQTYFHYAGPWHVEGDEVIHQARIALNPNFTGTEQRRKVSFAADGTLTLSADDTDEKGRARHHVLVWRTAGRQEY